MDLKLIILGILSFVFFVEARSDKNDITSEVKNLMHKVESLLKSQTLMAKTVVQNKVRTLRLLQKESLMMRNMTSMKEIMKQNQKEIKDLKDEIESLRPKPTHETPSTTVDPMSPVYYPPGTKAHAALRRYPQFKVKYAGFGVPTGMGLGKMIHANSFEHCLFYFHQLRQSKEAEWNGFVYWWGRGYCNCFTKDNGKTKLNSGSLHFVVYE